jgi:hypothetical protein
MNAEENPDDDDDDVVEGACSAVCGCSRIFVTAGTSAGHGSHIYINNMYRTSFAAILLFFDASVA